MSIKGLFEIECVARPFPCFMSLVSYRCASYCPFNGILILHSEEITSNSHSLEATTHATLSSELEYG